MVFIVLIILLDCHPLKFIQRYWNNFFGHPDLWSNYHYLPFSLSHIPWLKKFEYQIDFLNINIRNYPIVLWTEYLHPPKCLCGNPYTWCDGVKKLSLYNEISAFKRKDDCVLSLMSNMWGYSKKNKWPSANQ